MVSFPRLRLVNVAIGLTGAAILCCLWASRNPVMEGNELNLPYMEEKARWLYIADLSTYLVLATLCAWFLTLVVALFRRHQNRRT